MVSFQPAKTFKFSAKSSVIYLPEFVFSLSKEEQEQIQYFATQARSLYIQKCTQFSIAVVGKKISHFLFRKEAIQEAVEKAEEVYPDFSVTYSTYLSLQKPKVLRTPKPLSSTYLDQIESDS